MLFGVINLASNSVTSKQLMQKNTQSFHFSYLDIDMTPEVIQFYCWEGKNNLQKLEKEISELTAERRHNLMMTVQFLLGKDEPYRNNLLELVMQRLNAQIKRSRKFQQLQNCVNLLNESQTQTQKQKRKDRLRITKPVVSYHVLWHSKSRTSLATSDESLFHSVNKVVLRTGQDERMQEQGKTK